MANEKRWDKEKERERDQQFRYKRLRVRYLMAELGISSAEAEDIERERSSDCGTRGLKKRRRGQGGGEIRRKVKETIKGWRHRQCRRTRE